MSVNLSLSVNCVLNKILRWIKITCFISERRAATSNPVCTRVAQIKVLETVKKRENPLEQIRSSLKSHMIIQAFDIHRGPSGACLEACCVDRRRH